MPTIVNNEKEGNEGHIEADELQRIENKDDRVGEDENSRANLPVNNDLGQIKIVANDCNGDEGENLDLDGPEKIGEIRRVDIDVGGKLSEHVGHDENGTEMIEDNIIGGQREAQNKSKRSAENIGTDPSRKEEMDDAENDSSGDIGMVKQNSAQEGSTIERKRSDTDAKIGPSKQDEKEDNANALDNGDDGEDLLSIQSESFANPLIPPLPGTDDDDICELTSAPKEREMEGKRVGDDKNEESRGKDQKVRHRGKGLSKMETDNIGNDKSSSLRPPITAPKDKALVSAPKKRKRGRPSKEIGPDGYMEPSVEAEPAEAMAALQAAAILNPGANPMYPAMLHNPQTMVQQRVFHNNAMQRAAHAMNASMMMAASGGVIPHFMNAANGGIAPMMMVGAPAGVAAPNYPGSSNRGYNWHTVTFDLPVDGKLGMILDDNSTSGKPEMKRIADDSPIKDHIPPGFRTKCCIGYMKSKHIGRVQPKTAKECVELIAKAKAGATSGTIKMEILLIHIEQTMGPNNIAVPMFPPPALNHVSPRKKKKSKSDPTRDSNWQKKYNDLVKHSQLHGNCHVSNSDELTHWISIQRERKRKKLLGAKRVEMLNQIGFNWNIDNLPTDSEQERRAAALWDEMFCAVARFKNRCGLFPTSGHLHEWIEHQKEAVANRTIARPLAWKLLELGMEFPPEFSDELKCAYGVNFVNEAKEEEEAMPKSKNGKASQRRPYKVPSPAVFWNSRDAAKLFGFNPGDDVLKGLQDRIELLKKANQSVNGWKGIIPDDNKDDQYSQHEIMYVRHKAQYLIKAYTVAMEKTNQESWLRCCEIAATELIALGLSKINGRGVARWNACFRTANTFPHPGRHGVEKETNPMIRIFEYFPKAKEMFHEIANENKHKMTGKFMHEEFKAKILPTLERESRAKGCFDDGSKEQKMLVKMVATPPSIHLVLKWMGELNIEWDQWCTRKGRAKDGGSYLSQRMAEAWASGKYANRRAKGQGLKKGEKPDVGNEKDANLAAVDEEFDMDIADIL